MKRNLLITLAALTLAGALIIFFRPVPTSPSEVAGVSQKDFQRIRQVTRHVMWRAAFPDFSTRTIIGAPRSLYRLITSRIEQIDVLPLNLFRVQVKTGSDLHWYAVEKYQKKPGQNDWRASTKSADVAVFNLRGGPGFAEIRVDGGLGLVGGRLSSEPVPWLVQLPRPRSPRASFNQTDNSSASASNHLRLTYEIQPWNLDDLPLNPSPPWMQRPAPSETQFSRSLSNSSLLNLRP